MIRSDVLIIGAGPTGLVLALWPAKLGVKVRILDKTAEPGTTSRALACRPASRPWSSRRALGWRHRAADRAGRGLQTGGPLG
jgi:2-polyprenyl-6-methoxyphenol hydroxylase-like FAD-dependent oxidoreductase